MVDQAGLIRLMGGDGDLFRRVAGLFAADAPKRVLAMRAALEAGDGENLSRLAHALKGSVANFSAAEAVSAARRLEDAARNGDLVQAGAALEAVENTVRRLQSELHKIEISAAEFSETAG